MYDWKDDQLDPSLVAESYQAIRDWLIESTEREKREVVDRQKEWMVRRPRSRFETLLEHLVRVGMDHDERRRLYEEKDRLLKARGDAYREYLHTLESETREDLAIARRPIPADLKLLAPDAALAMPYAVVSLASDRQILTEDYLAEEIHNPNLYAQKMDQNVYRPLKVDLWGSGDGLYGWLPDYNHVQWADVFWFHLYDPHWSPTPPANWSYYAHVWLHGALACWADDGVSESLYARIEVETRVRSYPLKKLASDPASETIIKNFDFEGQNINVYHQNIWKNVHKLTPYPWHRNLPQWVIVQVHACATVRGEAHSMANFSTGGGPSLPFGTYCPGVKIL